MIQCFLRLIFTAITKLIFKPCKYGYTYYVDAMETQDDGSLVLSKNNNTIS